MNQQKTETAIFGAGCFWGVEESFRNTEGVLETEAGYCGGHTENPTYKQVCSGDTGHAEVVRVKYDTSKIQFNKLLDLFWEIHNPTTLNRQGLDVGSQYRSVIYCSNDLQLNDAEKSRDLLDKSGKHKATVVTEIKIAGTFYPAEEYHQKYYLKNGIQGCSVN